MKKFLIILLFVATALLLISCGECAHEWKDATCDEPKTCTKCGETEGEPTNHALGEWVETPATCTEDGSRTRSCVCGQESETETIEKTGHSIVEHAAKKPSCTETGWAAYETCSRCDYTTYEELPEAHDYEMTVVEATCTTGGYTLYDCTKCDNSYKANETAAKSHSFSDWVIVEASCEADGSKTRSCSCGHTESEVLTKLGHDVKDVAAKDSSCIAVGWGAHKACSRCNYKEGYVEVAKKDHAFLKSTVEPTCTVSGYTTFSCMNCGFRYVGDETAPRHSFGDWQTVAPTCFADGHKTRSCSACGESETETIPTQGHSFGDWQTVNPTCTENGYKTRSCSACGESETETIPTQGHSFGDWQVFDSTCSAAGHKTRSCSVCGEPETEDIPMKPHEYIDHPAQAATCEEDGWDAYQTCKNCDYNSQVIIPASHNYESEVVPYTCTERGYTVHTCTECGDTYTDSYTEPSGHSTPAWTLVRPTLTHNGRYECVCDSCGQPQTKALEVITTGQVGDSNSQITYTLYEDGTMKFVGEGAMAGCGWNGKNQPYVDHKNSVKRVVIGNGITAVSYGSCAYFKNLTEIIYPENEITIGNNAFLSSFGLGTTTITIPENVKRIGLLSFGRYETNKGSALLTDIIIENPDIAIECGTDEAKFKTVFNNGENIQTLNLYSYGKNNNVQAYAELVGANYIDLNDLVRGTVGNLYYNFEDGVLTLTAVDPLAEAVLPESSPWLEKKTDVTKIVIGNGVKNIPYGYFTDYTALTSVELPDSIESIGSLAFASQTAPCATALSINFSTVLSTLGENIFLGRENVSLRAYNGTAAEGFNEVGVSVTFNNIFKLLFLGNSLSLDAADNSGAGQASQLYNIIRAMVSDEDYVIIGSLMNGAKTAAWHASKAYLDESVYQFSVISNNTDGKWEALGSISYKNALQYTNWQHVSIQTYGDEAKTGVASAPDAQNGDTHRTGHLPQFLNLNASLPYLLDLTKEFAPNAKAYYYLIWRSYIPNASKNETLGLNDGLSGYKSLANVVRNSEGYVGTNSGKGFDAVIPAGAAIQSARSTYLALLNYSDATDSQIGLQRDNPHASYCLGRYIVGLLFAEMLVPEEMRVEGYEARLPGVKDSPVAGTLPAEYTELAKLAVADAINSISKEGTNKYIPDGISGYTVDPANQLKAAVEAMSFTGVAGADDAALKTAIVNSIKAEATASTVADINVSVEFTSVSATEFTATVTITFGYTTATATVSGTRA